MSVQVYSFGQTEGIYLESADDITLKSTWSLKETKSLSFSKILNNSINLLLFNKHPYKVQSVWSFIINFVDSFQDVFKESSYFQDVFKESSYYQRKNLIITHSFQENMCQRIWCCHNNDTLFKSLS